MTDQNTQVQYTAAYAAAHIHTLPHFVSPSSEPSNPSTFSTLLDTSSQDASVWVRWSRQTKHAVPELDAAGLPLSAAFIFGLLALLREHRRS